MLASTDPSLKRTLLDLRMDQFMVLLWLSAGGRDGPGREATEIGPSDLAIAEDLVRIGLARVDDGWRKSRWYRLTAESWNVVDERTP